MEQPGQAVWFIGDLDDPWVVEIADALPAVTNRFACRGDVPDGLLDMASPPTTLVLHRAVLTRHDAERVAKSRSSHSPAPRVVLCFGSHVRPDDLVSGADLTDAAVSEATASETLSAQGFARR